MAGSKRGRPVGSKNKIKARKPVPAAAVKLPTGNRYKIGRPLGTKIAAAGVGKMGANNDGVGAGGKVMKKRGRPSGSGSGRVGRPPGKRAVSSQGEEPSGDKDTSCPEAVAFQSMHSSAVNDAPTPSAGDGRGRPSMLPSPTAGKATTSSPAAAAPTAATAAAAAQVSQGVMPVGGTQRRMPPARKPLAVRTTEAAAQPRRPRPPRKRKAPALHDAEDPALLEPHTGSPSAAQAQLPPGRGVGSGPCMPAGDSVRQGASRVRKARLSQNSTGNRGKAVAGVGGMAREEPPQHAWMGVPTPPSKPEEGSGAGTSGRGGGVKRGKARQDSGGQGPGGGHTQLPAKDQAEVVDVCLQTSQSRLKLRRLARQAADPAAPSVQRRGRVQAAHTGSKVGGCEGEGCPEALPAARKGRRGSAYGSRRVGAACAPMPEKKGVGRGKAQAAGVVTHTAGGKRAAPPASAHVGGESCEARRQSKRVRK